MSIGLSGPAFQWPVDEPATLSELLQSLIHEHRDTRCIEIDAAGGRTSRTVDEQFYRALTILGALRASVPVGQSDIVLCFESALDLIPAMWACLLDGYTCLPWRFQRAASESAVRSWFETIGQKLNRPILITTDSVLARFASIEPSPFEATLSLEQIAGARAEAKFAGHGAAGELLVLTSGTTGSSKIVATSARSLLSRYHSIPRLQPGQNQLVNVPFGGLTAYALIFPSAGNHIYLQLERFAARPLDVLYLAEEFGLHTIPTSSSLAARIIEAAEAAPRRPGLSSVGHVGFGSEMIVPSIVLKFGAMLQDMGAHNLKMSFGYGMTETGLLCRTKRLTLEEMRDRLQKDLTLASVGHCTPGWLLRVVDDAGNALEDGTEGNVEAWSETKLFSGYRNDPELTRASFTEDGWFKTGDIGRIEGGELVLMGRQKSIIIVNGRNISLEAIEAPLREIDGIRRSLIAAAAVRFEQSPTDELALFFVPREGEPLDDLCRRLLHSVSTQGLPVKHLVPVEEADFPLTATGKVRRNELTALYQSGTLRPHKLPRPGAGRGTGTETETWLIGLWRNVLKLEFDPACDDDFFALGGDSLASAELIFAVEERFSCNLPLEAFFARPTIANMEALLAKHSAPALQDSAGSAPESGAGLLHKLRGYSASWRGHRNLPDSLIVGFNLAGVRMPIVWITQEYREAVALAKHLGPEQPLYVARSCVGIVPVKDYSTDILETVTNRYLWEVLALPIRGPFILGGTCQGGIIALALARRLNRIKRPPALLALMEWGSSYGAYLGPTLLIYGQQSYTAKIYEGESHAIDWRNDFPHHIVASVPGTHGEIANADESVSRVAEVLREHGDRVGAPVWLKALRRTRRALRRVAAELRRSTTAAP